jgi:hypothetical protein
MNAKLLIDGAVAVGTLLLAAVAIWGDWLRSWLAPAKLAICPHNLRGAPTLFGDPPVRRVMY